MEVDTVEVRAAAAAVAADTLMGTIATHEAITTTTLATPMGMTTCGLDIVM